MSVLQKSNKKVSARQQIDIKRVKDGVLMLPNNKYRIVLSVSPVNFELKSEDEQDAIIDTYESFLNSVGGPLQMLIRIREMDMDAYLGELDKRLQSEKVAIYKRQLANYEEFIRELITTNRILSRQFYVIVPYNSDGKADFDLSKSSLAYGRYCAKRPGTARHALARIVQPRIMDLFYNFYNPTRAKLQPLTDKALELIHTSYIQKEQQHEYIRHHQTT